MNEILRRIANIIQVGTICEIDSQNRALARVKLLDRVSDFLPVLMFANTFKTHFVPMRVNEQVLVVCPFGNADAGFILRGIFNKGQKEPEGHSDDTEVIKFSDGTKFSYDTQNKKLTGHFAGDLEINIIGSATINAEGNIKANATKIGLNDGAGVVTGECICAFTGSPHSDVSNTVTAGK